MRIREKSQKQMNQKNMENSLSKKQIKEGWQTVKFGEIAKEVRSTTQTAVEDGLEFYVGLEHLEPRSLLIQRKGLIADDNPSFTRRFKAGQILFGKRRCYQRKAAVPHFEGICSGDIIVMEAIPEKIIPELLPFIVQSDPFFDWAEKNSSGSLSPRTKWKALAEFEFSLPPFKRQKTILAVLEKSAVVDKKHEEIGKSVFNSITTLQLKLFPNNFESHQRNFVSLEEGWKSYRLGKLLLSQPESGFSANEITGNSKWHVLNLNCLCKTGFINNGYKSIAKTSFEENKKLTTGDFLISRSNTKDLVGLVGIYKENGDEAIFPDTMMRLNIDKSTILPEFLEVYLLSPYGRRQIVRLAAGTSGSMVKINKENIKKIPVPVPSIRVQNKIIEAYQRFCWIRDNNEKQKALNYSVRKKYLSEALFV